MENNDFGTEQQRDEILKANPGILSRVAEKLRVSPGTISRTFHGLTKKTTPKIVKALSAAIEAGKR